MGLLMLCKTINNYEKILSAYPELFKNINIYSSVINSLQLKRWAAIRKIIKEIYVKFFPANNIALAFSGSLVLDQMGLVSDIDYFVIGKNQKNINTYKDINKSFYLRISSQFKTDQVLKNIHETNIATLDNISDLISKKNIVVFNNLFFPAVLFSNDQLFLKEINLLKNNLEIDNPTRDSYIAYARSLLKNTLNNPIQLHNTININFLIKKIKILIILNKLNKFKVSSNGSTLNDLYILFLMLRDYFCITYPEKRVEPSWSNLNNYENIFHIHNLKNKMISANELISNLLGKDFN